MDAHEFALITGASSGIGECFAKALAARHYNLALVARSQGKLESLSQELKSRHGIAAEPLAMDLIEPGAAGKLVQALATKQMEISLLINNAGFGAQGEFWKIPEDRQAQMLRLNLQALVELCYRLIPAMVGKRRGAIINVSSTASFQPLPYTSVYAATKAFVTSFSMGLAEELRPYGVKVVTLCPGPTRTNFFDAGSYRSVRIRKWFQGPEKVVQAGLRSLDRGGGLTLCRPLDETFLFFERFLPRSWVARMVTGMFKPTG